MWEWITRRGPTKPERADPDAAADYRPVIAGKSAPLHKYLNDRYADAVVLTFAEIEDLLGFALPAVARLSDAWWTKSEPAVSRFADAWLLAHRTARPNLRALTVAFERIP